MAIHNPVTDMSEGPFAVELQTDATYTYIAEAAPGTALATASWRAQRITTGNGTTKWADGDDNFDNVATTLSSLSYS